MSLARGRHVRVRQTEPRDFDEISALCRRVYPWVRPWTEAHLASHHRVFPEGQLVAVDWRTHRIVGMCASLIIRWDDYDIEGNYVDFTDGGTFTNHDPLGRTLYGAEVMVDPSRRGRGVGKQLYAARRRLVRALGLRRIRAGARLRGYHRFADRMSAEAYAVEVAWGRLRDPTVSFQLKQGFRIIAVVSHYDDRDPESLGHAAIIEWLNAEAARDPSERPPSELPFTAPPGKRPRGPGAGGGKG